MADFSDVYKRYFRDVYHYAFSLCKNEALAEEITQETFFKALSSLESFDGKCKVSVWLCQIAKNTYISICRKEKHLDHETDTGLLVSNQDIEEKYLTRESAFEIHRILHKLPEPYKEVFSLRAFGELSYDQIAELFGKTETWARVTYHPCKTENQGGIEMKTSCKIIEDLLPMYHDGISSEESAALIEEHLKECESCRQILASLRGEIVLPKEVPTDDLKPLEEIQHQITKEKKRSGRRGAIVAVSVLLAIFLIWTSIWYFGYAIHYDRLAKPLDKVSDQVAAMTTAGHTLEVGEHRIVLKHPGFLGEGGFVHVGPKEGMVIFLDEEYNQIGQNKEVWIDMFFYPEFGGGYRFALNIDNGEESWWTWLTPELTYNYDLYDAASAPKEEIEAIEQLLISHHDEIVNLFDTVKDVWGIEFLSVK